MKGEYKEPLKTYSPQLEEEYDVCEECAKLCTLQGFKLYDIVGETEIEID